MGKYFGLGKDWDEITGSKTSGGTRALAGLKILGKVVANVGTFAVTEVVPGMIEQGSKQVAKGLEEKRHEMTPEQIEKAESLIQNGKDVARRRQEARDIEDQVEEKTRQLEAEKERHPKANPVAQELSKEIAQLEAKKPKWYDSNA
jgi:hypothetical protein